MNSQAGSDKLVEEMLTHLKPPIPLKDHDDDSEVAAFYANRGVFVTGATGFMGKALIEKLVRSCPRLGRIYILMREKRGKSVHARLADLIESQCFDRIRELHGGSSRVLQEKLCAIRGDITEPKFGIAPEDMQVLSRECTIVFNSAATIRFHEPIDNAVRNNIYSVGQLVEFCNELAHLEALIHLSTAYSNCHKRDTIYEILYEPPMRGDEILGTIETLRKIQEQIHVYPERSSNLDVVDDNNKLTANDSYRDACKMQRFYNDNLNIVTKTLTTTKQQTATSEANKTVSTTTTTTSATSAAGPSLDLLGEFTRIALRCSNRPNTYTYTKAIGESYLLDKAREYPERYLNDKIPVAIVRPSIVGAAWREPMVGLVDNYNGATGPILSLYTGALQAMPGRGDRVADVVPVDMAINMVVCTAWFLVESQAALKTRKPIGECDAPKIKQDHGMYLFNFVSGYRNPLRWREVTELIAKISYKYPTKYLMRLPGSYFVQSGKVYELYDTINQKFPAHVIDFVKSKLCRQRLERRSSAVVGHARIKQMADTLTPFTSNQWKLNDDNTQALFETLTEADKQVFHFDVASIDFRKYICAFIIGARVYLLRDEAKNVPAAMKQLQRRRVLNWIGIGSLIVLIYCIFVSCLFI